jgi:hypothetical protein
MVVAAQKVERLMKLQKIKSQASVILCAILLVSCSTKQVLQVENSDKLLKIDDYEKSLKVKDTVQPAVKVEAPPPAAAVSEKPTLSIPLNGEEKPKKVSKYIAVKKEPTVIPAHKLKKKEPSIEDAEGFDGRRPIVDPFRPGESVTLKLSYFNMTAGDLVMGVLPFKEVNGKKSYHFSVGIKSNSFFSSIYAADDSAETFMDYDTLLPYNMAVDVKETKQLRTVRSYFDWKKKKAYFWEKKITKKSGVEEKKLEWNIDAYAQNIFSAAFYMRVFTLTPGKVIEFKVSDNQKNMVVKANVIRRETLQTDIGELKTVVIKPEIAIDGIFKPMGEVFFWLTDDDRKFVVRIESKIKIGTIVGSLKEIVP